MNPNGTLLPLVEKIRGQALIVGVAATGASVVLGYFFRNDFHRAYLFTYFFFLGLSLGSLALLMVHRQLGGAWGFLIRRQLESAAMILPLMLVLFIPILIELGGIYPWANPKIDWEHEEVASHHAAKKAAHEDSPVTVESASHESPSFDPASPLAKESEELVAKFKRQWLTPEWFTVRVGIYFTLWIGLALILGIGSKRQDETGSTDLAYRLNGLSAPGLVIYFLSVSFAVIDWGMSLEPKWYSTLYGVLLMIGQVISATALMIIVAAVISRRGELEGLDKPETFNDLGNLLLAFTMLWGYLSFSQFLIIWAGNLTEDIPWYMRRLHGGWQWIGIFLIVFHFAVPFLILLVRPIKRNISALWKVAALVLAAHLIDDFWLIGASRAFDPRNDEFQLITDPNPNIFRVTLLDFVVPIAVGGLWLTAFLRVLKSRPLMIAHDPQLLPALKQASGGH
jgi:hypothetical protein